MFSRYDATEDYSIRISLRGTFFVTTNSYNVDFVDLVYTCVCMRIYIYVYMYMHVCVYICMSTYWFVCFICTKGHYYHHNIQQPLHT